MPRKKGQQVQKKPHIDYYFTTLSSFAYIGHWAFQDLIAELDCTITYKPIQLGKVFAASGGLGLGDRHPARLRNRTLELLRWSAKRGLEMNVAPKYFPTNPTLPDCVVIVLQNHNIDPAPFMAQIMRSLWVKEQDIAEAETVRQALEDCGLDAKTLLEEAKQEEVLKEYEGNTAQGIALDIIGSPTPVYQGEPFWGQDRFELLQDAILSNRAPHQVK